MSGRALQHRERLFRYTLLVSRQIEAVSEDGVLRPLEPLSLKDRQRVTLTIAERVAHVPFNERVAERDWLRHHESEYPGQWLALSGDQLVSHGPDARTLRDEARAKGVAHPLMVRIPLESELPSAGWLLCRKSISGVRLPTIRNCKASACRRLCGMVERERTNLHVLTGRRY